MVSSYRAASVWSGVGVGDGRERAGAGGGRGGGIPSEQTDRQTDTGRLHAAGGGEDVDGGSELSGAESGRVTGFCV